MQINRLTYLAAHLSAAREKSEHEAITVAEVQGAIFDGSIFDFLRARIGDDFDPLGQLAEAECDELAAEWYQLRNLDEGRVWGVERSGLALLIAYLMTGIANRASKFERPHAHPAAGEA